MTLDPASPAPDGADAASPASAVSHPQAPRRSLPQWPVVVVLLALLAGLGITASGHWRRGSFAIGCSVLLAGLLRAALPDRVAGVLAVRARWADSLLLLLVGGGMLAITMVVPHSPPHLG